MVFAVLGVQGPPPPADLCTPSSAAQLIILRFETIQEGCRCLQEEEEEEEEGEGREAGSRTTALLRALTHTHCWRGDINLGQKRAERVRFPPELNWEGQRCPPVSLMGMGYW